MRVETNFRDLFTDHDDAAYKLVLNIMKGEFDWFKGDLVEPIMPSVEELETMVRKLA
jgi:hypothetical protein